MWTGQGMMRCSIHMLGILDKTMKKCPKCGRFSVEAISFGFIGVVCLWNDCDFKSLSLPAQDKKNKQEMDLERKRYLDQE